MSATFHTFCVEILHIFIRFIPGFKTFIIIVYYILLQNFTFKWYIVCCSSCSVTKLYPNSLRPHELQHARFLCSSLSLRVCSNSCLLSQWCYLTISSFPTLLSYCPKSFPALESFPMSQFITSDGQSIGASTSASVLPMNIQGWFPLVLTGLMSLQSKGLSRVFCHTMVQKHLFFSAQPSLWFNSHIHTWLRDKL